MLPDNRLAYPLWGIPGPPLFAFVKPQEDNVFILLLAVKLACNSRNLDVLIEFNIKKSHGSFLPWSPPNILKSGVEKARYFDGNVARYALSMKCSVKCVNYTCYF